MGEAVVTGAAQRWFSRSLRRLFSTPWLVIALFAMPVVLVAVGIVSWVIDWRLGVDSAVYRSAAIALLTGEPLYDNMFLAAEPDWARLPFTYPPAGALLFVPLAAFPTQVSWGLLGALSVLAMALVVRVTIQYLPSRPTWLTPARTTILLSLLALAIEPVWRTLALGQINLILMALVVVDVLVLGQARYFGGVLVGVAAAVKLIPLIFVPHLWLIGRRADAVRAVVTFVALQAVIFAISAHDLRQFLSVTDPERTGATFWARNQSLNALMQRLTDLAPWALWAAIGIGTLLAIPAIYLARRFHQRGEPVPALLVTAFFGLLFSPITWTHHYVWVVPLVGYLLSTKPAWLAVIAIFVVCPPMLVPGSDPNHPSPVRPELDWTPVEALLGNTYLLVPLVAGVVVLARALRARQVR